MSTIMNDTRFLACLAETLKWEGRFCVDDGGPTMEGITQTEFDAWRHAHKAALGPVRGILDGELHDIYYNDYWLKAGCGSYEPGLDLCVFDAAVNAGVGSVHNFLVQHTTDIV